MYYVNRDHQESVNKSQVLETTGVAALLRDQRPLELRTIEVCIWLGQMTLCGEYDYVTFELVVCWLEVQDNVSVLLSCIEALYYSYYS